MVYLFFEPVFLDEFCVSTINSESFRISISQRIEFCSENIWDLSGFRAKLQNKDKKSGFWGRCQMADFSRHFLSFCNQFAIFGLLLSPKVVKVLGYHFAASFMVRSSQVIEKHHFLQSGSIQSRVQKTVFFFTIEITHAFS